MRIICFLVLSINSFSIYGQGIRDLYPSIPKDTLVFNLKSNGFNLVSEDITKREIEFQKITKQGKLTVQSKFDSNLKAKSIRIKFPKITSWMKLKLAYDKIRDSLTMELGKPTKILTNLPVKKGNELIELKNGKIRMLTSFMDDYAVLEILNNQSIQIQLNNTIVDENAKEEDILIITGKTKEICVGKPIDYKGDCTDYASFSEDFDANYKVAIIETIICDNKKYFIVNKNNRNFMINARYIEIDNYFEFNEVARISSNQKYKLAAYSYSANLSKIISKEFSNYLEKQKSVGLILINYSVEDVSEVTEGVSVRFEVFNPTNKSIKYITFYVAGINPVGDVVYNLRQHSNISEFKGVGPIKQKESGNYEWEYAWFTDVVETLKIIKVKVQYMDGTVKTLTSLKSFLLPSKYDKLLKEYENN